MGDHWLPEPTLAGVVVVVVAAVGQRLGGLGADEVPGYHIRCAVLAVVHTVAAGSGILVLGLEVVKDPDMLAVQGHWPIRRSHPCPPNLRLGREVALLSALEISGDLIHANLQIEGYLPAWQVVDDS